MVSCETILAFGGNLGDTRQLSLLALHKLVHRGVLLCPRVSSFYRSPSLLRDNQPDYLNMVARASTCVAPAELLKALKEAEREAGRVDRGRWKERELDIDIIDYGGVVSDAAELTLPHSQMHLRGFVLLPLREVAPGYIHPIFKKSIDELIAGCLPAKPYGEG